MRKAARGIASNRRTLPEYEILQPDLSGAVHSSPTSLLAGASFSETGQLLLLGWKLWFRVLGRISAHHGVPLSKEQEEIVHGAMSNLYDFQPASRRARPPEPSASAVAVALEPWCCPN